MTTPAATMLLGALTADAAALGLHWIYDAERIAQIARAQRGQTAFTPIDPAHYDGVPAYFAHGARRNGMRTQYGEVLHLAIRNLIAQNRQFDAAAYRTAFAAHFGPGGSFNGYIDGPTRGALAAIAAEQEVTGIDDDQLPATTTLPAILAAYHGSDLLDEKRIAAMEVTNINPVAAAYSAAFADLLSRLLSGTPLRDALSAAAKAAAPDISGDLTGALTSDTDDSTAFAGDVGRACHLPMGGPVIFHILNRADSFTDAAERNILAGGDSAGRAILIGAAMGAVHGVATPQGIPLDWVLQLDDGATLWADCRALTAA